MGHGVPIEHMNPELVAGLNINHRAGHAAMERRFVYIPQNEFVHLGDQVAWIEVLPVNERGQYSRIYFAKRHGAIFVAGVAHTVAAVLDGRRGGGVGVDGAVVGDLLNLEIDVTRRHCSCHFRQALLHEREICP